MANHGLVDASFQQLVLLTQTISPALGDIVKTIRGYHSAFLTDLQQTAGRCLGDVQRERDEAALLQAQIDNSEGEITKLMEVADLLDKVSRRLTCIPAVCLTPPPPAGSGGQPEDHHCPSRADPPAGDRNTALVFRCRRPAHTHPGHRALVRAAEHGHGRGDRHALRLLRVCARSGLLGCARAGTGPVGSPAAWAADSRAKTAR